MKNIVIIGAGILGASAAYHLSKTGVKVHVIDRFDKGQATDAAAGIICPWISQRRNKAWYNLVKKGAAYYTSLINQLEQDGETETGYDRVGAISLHKDQEKLEKMAERAIKRREDAPEIGEVKVLTPAQTKELFPVLSGDYGSVFVSGGAKVNGRALRNALISASKKNGVTYVSGNASLFKEENVVTGVQVDEKLLPADQVILTGGAWSSEVLFPLGVQFKVVPQKAQIIHLELDNKETQHWPVVMPPNNQYILTFENGLVVVGATHEDEAGFDTRVTAGGMNEILSKTLEVAPGLTESTIVETRVGFRPFTPGFLPVIGKLPEHENIIIANGLGASGLTSGPYLGAELARLAMGLPMELEINDYDVTGAISKLV
ncbi:FAD-binding oxidoreductase [Sutcliffiella horikoshii]|uniref:NAD(P)/FAD-dependent oxidoreductase n=1 Tax=Sutcliffiella horikoshii TaxID=79883 RepID=UPI002040C83D|nr:FAD-dependent oxidoreductase [Sutcliffiella horikoshii]MCM3616046.1 FAD-binding oxidoreductase [Sutcliffiella horikoshii]